MDPICFLPQTFDKILIANRGEIACRVRLLSDYCWLTGACPHTTPDGGAGKDWLKGFIVNWTFPLWLITMYLTLNEGSVLIMCCFIFHQVIKTCRKMGIKSVAVHSDVDSSAVSCVYFPGNSCQHPPLLLFQWRSLELLAGVFVYWILQKYHHPSL